MSVKKKPEIMGYPSEFVSPEVKSSPKYLVQYAKAFINNSKHNFDTEYNWYYDQNIQRYRAYGRGEQSKNQYKELAGIKRDGKGRLQETYRNLNWDNLKIVPKLRNVLIGRLLNTMYSIDISFIDPKGIKELNDVKSKMKAQIMSQEHMEFLKSMGISMPSPETIDGKVPTSFNEVEDLINNPKDQLPADITDILLWIEESNNDETIMQSLIEDLIDTGYAAKQRYIDGKGMIRYRHCKIERMIANKCIEKDFSDLIRVGEFREITISELRQETKGKWPETDYMHIANKYTKRQGGGNAYTGQPEAHYNKNTMSFAYDHTKITILDFRFRSADTITYTSKKDSSGNVRLKRRDFHFNHQMDDAAYEELNNAKIHRVEGQNVYGGCYIVDTDYIYNEGQIDNTEREVGNLWNTSLGYSITTTDWFSTIGMIENVVDMLQLNWLQFQSHLQSSKPKGVAVEYVALSKTVGKKDKVSPREMLQLYSETGNIVWNGYDNDGNPLPWFPIQELEGGISPAAADHFKFCIEMIDFLRMILGINPVVEGQAPEPRQGKFVSMLAVDASDNALTYLRKSIKRLREGSVKGTINQIPKMAQKLSNGIMDDVVGTDTRRLVSTGIKTSLRRMGIKVNEIDKDKLLTIIRETIAGARQDGFLPPEDAAELLTLAEKNPHKIIPILRKKRNEFAEKQQQAKQQDNQMAQQLEAQKAQMSIQGEIQKETNSKNLELRNKQVEQEGDLRTKVVEGILEIAKAAMTGDRQIKLEQLKGEIDIASSMVQKMMGSGSSSQPKSQTQQTNSETQQAEPAETV